jgi:hypothetical protein
MATLTEIAKKRAPGSRKPATKNRKPATGNQKPVAGVRAQHPYEKIAAMYNDGKSWDEIAEATKIKRSSMNGISDRLAAGVKVGDRTVKIVRGKRSAAKKSAAA